MTDFIQRSSTDSQKAFTGTSLSFLVREESVAQVRQSWESKLLDAYKPPGREPDAGGVSPGCIPKSKYFPHRIVRFCQ